MNTLKIVTGREGEGVFDEVYEMAYDVITANKNFKRKTGLKVGLRTHVLFMSDCELANNNYAEYRVMLSGGAGISDDINITKIRPEELEQYLLTHCDDNSSVVFVFAGDSIFGNGVYDVNKALELVNKLQFDLYMTKLT